MHPGAFFQVSPLRKTLLVGIILGVVGAAVLTYYLPAVDLHREPSYVEVQPNGGNSETFRINLPRDRILVGLAGAEISVPAGVEWPSDSELGDFQTEIFKIRDRNDAVIGVASRMANSTDETGAFIEWSLHLPARGTLYVQMDMTPAEGGYRDGRLRAGTHDFRMLRGTVREHFIANVEDSDDGTESRIELVTALIGTLPDDAEDFVATNETGESQ